MRACRRDTVTVSLIVAFGGFLVGFDASVISGVVPFIESQFSLGRFALGWSVASLTLTATVAMLVAGPLSDRFGRRPVLLATAALFAVSALASALAPDFASLIAARMLGGFAVGAALIVAPMYIAEISPPKVRGRMVSLNQLNSRHTARRRRNGSHVVLAGVLGFVASFAISVGPVMWVLFSELFPNWIRGFAISFVGVVNSSVSFIVQIVFPWELQYIGGAGTFLAYAAFAIAGIFVVLRVMPETKGVSLEKLEARLVDKQWDTEQAH